MRRRDQEGPAMKLVSKDCFKKRKKTLLNKAHELKTLCDVDVGLIIYQGDDNADDGNNSTKAAEIWPTDDPKLIYNLINSYHNTLEKETKRGPTKRKQPPPHICSSVANNKKQRKTEPPNYSVWDNRYDVLPIEKLKDIKGFLEDKISNLKGRYEEMLKSEITKARLEEIKLFLEVDEDSESLSDQCSPVSAGDAEMMMMPMLSPQNTNHQFEEYSGLTGIEQQRVIKDVDQFGLPIVSIGDSGMVLPMCYDNSNLYPYNYYHYSSMLCGGHGGDGDYLSQGGLIGGGSPMTMITERRGLSVNVDVLDDLLLDHVVYYSGPPSPLCY